MKNFLTSLALLGLTSSLTLTLNITRFDQQSAFAQSSEPATDLIVQTKPQKRPLKIQQSCAARSTNRNPASRMKPLKVPKRYIIQSGGDRPAKPSNRILPSIVSPNPVDVTVINSTPVNNKPIRFIIYDFSIDQSGGIVDLFLNGKFLRTVNLTVQERL